MVNMYKPSFYPPRILACLFPRSRSGIEFSVSIPNELIWGSEGWQTSRVCHAENFGFSGEHRFEGANFIMSSDLLGWGMTEASFLYRLLLYWVSG